MCVSVCVFFFGGERRRYRCGGWRLERVGRLVVASAFFLRLGGLWYFGVVVVVSADPQYSREGDGMWMGLMGWDGRISEFGRRGPFKNLPLAVVGTYVESW